MSRKNLAILANLEKSGVGALHAEVVAWAQQQGYEVISNLAPDAHHEVSDGPFGPLSTEDLKQKFARADLLVTMGGDGTLLYAAQLVSRPEVVVLSVNLGSLGFHTQVSPHNLQECLAQLTAGTYQVERRLVLEASISGAASEDTKILALNDIVISKSAWGHVVSLRVSIDGEVVTDIAGDALIVSSPTGSSAYNYAARGPVLYPDLDAIILNALCAHRMRVAPLVIPGRSEIEVRLRPRKAGETAQVLNDGQPWRTIGDNESLKISRAAMYLPLIVFENDFYGKLRDKLRWGGLF